MRVVKYRRRGDWGVVLTWTDWGGGKVESGVGKRGEAAVGGGCFGGGGRGGVEEGASLSLVKGFCDAPIRALT